MPTRDTSRFSDDIVAALYDKEGFQIDPKTQKRVENGGVIDPKTGATIRPPVDIETGLPLRY